MTVLGARELLAAILGVILVSLAYKYSADLDRSEQADLQDKLYWNDLQDERANDVLANIENKATSFIHQEEKREREERNTMRKVRLMEQEPHLSWSNGLTGEGGYVQDHYLSKDLMNRQVNYSPDDFNKAVKNIKVRMLKRLHDDQWIKNTVSKNLRKGSEAKQSRDAKHDGEDSILDKVEDVFAHFNVERTFSDAWFKTHSHGMSHRRPQDKSPATPCSPGCKTGVCDCEESSSATTGEAGKGMALTRRIGYLVTLRLSTARSSWSPAALAAALFEVATTPQEAEMDVQESSAFAPLASGSLGRGLEDYQLPLWDKGPGTAIASDYPAIVTGEDGNKAVFASIWISNDEGKAFSETDKNVLIYAISKGLVLPLSNIRIGSVDIKEEPSGVRDAGRGRHESDQEDIPPLNQSTPGNNKTDEASAPRAVKGNAAPAPSSPLARANVNVTVKVNETAMSGGPTTFTRCNGIDKPIGPPPLGSCKGLIVIDGPQQGEIDSGTPHPISFKQGADCRWLIKAPPGKDSITLDFDSFHLTGTHGHIRIYTGEEAIERFKTSEQQDSMLAYKTFTGIEPPGHSLVVPDREVLIAFRSEPCDQTAAFSLRWQASCSSRSCGEGSK
uniref:CUB domain-containing protein n=1 Tax=Hanusia phi TaxID=3032 RepID=A0A7S0EY29_9CRYP|mmetsp:Transcript_33355/g.74784  ORF Transcript_33355/g.74784 Transcript_33355/m.74784 type:complete len:617 (+) Transcript_33355:118-1968(+)